LYYCEYYIIYTYYITGGIVATVEDVKELIVEKIRLCSVDKGHPGNDIPCVKTLYNYINNSQLKVVNAQQKSTARLQAENDVMTAVSTAIMWSYVFEYVKNPNLVINFDATQFTYTKHADSTPQVVIPKNEKMNNYNQSKPISANNRSDADLLYFIKYFCMCTLTGYANKELVFVVADSRLKDDEMFVYKVIGLTTGSGADDFGYLVFTQTRCGNAKFFNWLIKVVLMDYIKTLRRLFGNDPAFITCDGEAQQIRPLMNEEDRKLMNDNNIIVGKLAASSTAVSQACDAYKIFSSAKACFKTTLNSEVGDRVTLKETLNDTMKLHVKKTSGCDKVFNESDKTRLIPALIKAVITLTKKLVSSVIIKSFNKIGISTKCEVVLRQVFQQFGTSFSNNHRLLQFMDNLKSGITKFHNCGTITDQEMYDLYDIVKDKFVDRNIDRDKLVMHQQRCVLLTHKATINRLDDAVNQKQQAILNKELRKQEKELEMANKAKALIEKRAEKESLRADKEKEREDTKEAVRVAKEKAIADKADKADKVNKRITGNKRKRDDLWCYCQRDDADLSPMVECSSGDNCKSGKWFHFCCIQHKNSWKPPKNWYCSICFANSLKK